MIKLIQRSDGLYIVRDAPPDSWLEFASFSTKQAAQMAAQQAMGFSIVAGFLDEAVSAVQRNSASSFQTQITNVRSLARVKEMVQGYMSPLWRDTEKS